MATNRQVTVQVQIGGNSTGLNTALSQSQAQARALQQGVNQAGQVQANQVGGSASQWATARAAQRDRGAQMLQLADSATSVARRGALAGSGLIASGIASLTPLSEQLGNSFRLLGGEIGLSVLPQVVRLSGWLQNAAGRFRQLNDASGGALGSGLFWTTAALGAAGLAGTGLNMARNAAGGLRWGAQALGLAADVAAPIAGQTIAQGARQAAAARAGTAAGSAGTAAGSGAAGAGLVAFATNPITWALAAVAAVGTAGYYGENAAIEQRARGEQPGFWTQAFQYGSWLSPGALIGRGIARLTTDDPAASAAAGARSLMNPDAQLGGDVSQLYDRILMSISGTPGPLGQQDAEARQRTLELLESINRNTTPRGQET